MEAGWRIAGFVSPVSAPRGCLNPVPSFVSLCLFTVPRFKCQQYRQYVRREMALGTFQGLLFRKVSMVESKCSCAIVYIVSLWGKYPSKLSRTPFKKCISKASKNLFCWVKTVEHAVEFLDDNQWFEERLMWRHINWSVLVSVIMNTDGSRRMFEAFYLGFLWLKIYHIPHFATGSVYFVVNQVKAFITY